MFFESLELVEPDLSGAHIIMKLELGVHIKESPHLLVHLTVGFQLKLLDLPLQDLLPLVRYVSLVLPQQVFDLGLGLLCDDKP